MTDCCVRLRILLITTQMEPAGAQKALMQLAAGLQVRGHAVTVACLYDKGFAAAFAETHGVPVKVIGFRRYGAAASWKTPLRLARGLARLLALLHGGRFDVVQTFSHYSNILIPPLAALCGVPVRITSQRMVLKGLPRGVLVADRLIQNSRFVHRMVAVSENVRRWCVAEEGVRAGKLAAIVNGIDLPAFDLAAGRGGHAVRAELGLDEKAVIAVTVARLSAQKGHDVLLRALRDVLPDHPELVLFLVGDGPLRRELEASVAANDLGRHVRFLGHRADVPRILKESDLFVLPSLWEGMPNAVLEAMAAGLPIVATAVDGTVEMLTHGEDGLLVAAEDAGALAAALRRALDDPHRDRLGQVARLRVERDFSLHCFIEGFERIYREETARQHG